MFFVFLLEKKMKINRVLNVLVFLIFQNKKVVLKNMNQTGYNIQFCSNSRSCAYYEQNFINLYMGTSN